MNRLIAFLERGNGGLRTLITIGGILLSLVTGVFIAGGIWVDLRRTAQETSDLTRELVLEMKGLRHDMTEVKTEMGLNSYFRQHHMQDHDEEEKRIERLERFQDGTRK